LRHVHAAEGADVGLAAAGPREQQAPLFRAGQGGPAVVDPRVAADRADLGGEAQEGGGGQRAQEVLKQPQYAPLSMAQQVTIFWALNNGFLDDVPVEKVQAFEAAFHGYMSSNKPQIAETIMNELVISDATEAALRAALQEFKNTVPY
jgi:F0F1-type ATP synthase alpha subunit